VRGPRLLDLYCCAGGAGRGYVDAGFDVYGVDIKPQPNYPYPFHQGDVLEVVAALLRGERLRFVGRDGEGFMLGLADFAAVHASPPCQFFSRTHGIHPEGRTGGGNGGYKAPRPRAARDDHVNLMPQTRALLVASGLPYIIENVVDAWRAMVDPILLCGTMFGLRTYRHRCFEANFLIVPPGHPAHTQGQTKGEGNSQGKGCGYSASTHGAAMITIAGNNFNRREGMAVMGIDWEATQKEVAQMIPPAYSAFIGRQLMARLAGLVAELRS
jgi:DNA (cytosine-5)-methyltransferase 1